MWPSRSSSAGCTGRELIFRTVCTVALFATVMGARAAPTAPGRDEQLVRTSQAAIGRPAGDWALIDQRGRAFRMSDLTDRPLVVSFIYTGCFQVCPATTQFLKRAVTQARAALGSGTFRVLTIGFNQPFDTPEALAAFARKQGIDDAEWLFAAPREADVPALLERFGLTVERTAGGFDHLIQMSVVGADGVIYRQIYGDSFDLPMFIGPLKELLSGQTTRAMTLENLWTKVKLYCTVYDPASGKYKFDYSLFVELFAGITFLAAVVWFMVRELSRARRESPRRAVKADNAAIDARRV